MSSLKVLGVLAQNEEGKVVFIEVDEWNRTGGNPVNTQFDESDLEDSGIVTIPTPAEIEFKKEADKKEISLNDIIVKIEEGESRKGRG